MGQEDAQGSYVTDVVIFYNVKLKLKQGNGEKQKNSLDTLLFWTSKLGADFAGKFIQYMNTKAVNILNMLRLNILPY